MLSIGTFFFLNRNFFNKNTRLSDCGNFMTEIQNKNNDFCELSWMESVKKATGVRSCKVLG